MRVSVEVKNGAMEGLYPGVSQLLAGGMYRFTSVRLATLIARYSICGSSGGGGRVWKRISL